jgi:hypothetical protein
LADKAAHNIQQQEYDDWPWHGTHGTTHMDDQKVKGVLADLLDSLLALTEQVNDLGYELLTLQTVLEEKVPGFAEELEIARTAAEHVSVKSDRGFAVRVEQSLRNLREIRKRFW